MIAAAGLACIGGEIQCRLWPRDERRGAARPGAGTRPGQVLTTRDLVNSDNMFFAATGVTSGDYLRGVDFRGDHVVTHSVIMRSKTGSIRYMDAVHNLARLREISAITLD